jgi:hypothetical protein
MARPRVDLVGECDSDQLVRVMLVMFLVYSVFLAGAQNLASGYRVQRRRSRSLATAQQGRS